MKCEHCKEEPGYELVELPGQKDEPGPRMWLCRCKRTLKLEQIVEP